MLKDHKAHRRETFRKVPPKVIPTWIDAIQSLQATLVQPMTAVSVRAVPPIDQGDDENVSISSSSMVDSPLKAQAEDSEKAK